jgi:hypothetical protein
MIDGMRKPELPEEVMTFFRKTGSIGGKARAMKYTKAELSAMGKKGGRPKGSGKKTTKKGAK